MEVTKISETSIKIKTKPATFAVSPVGTKTKVAADCVLLLDKTTNQSTVSLETEALILQGPGEYETKGVKITGLGMKDGLAYLGKFDSMATFISRLSTLAKTKDIVEEAQVVMVEADTETLEQTILASFNANVLLLYGTHAAAVAKSLGKDVAPASKYAVTREKLPTELEVVVL